MKRTLPTLVMIIGLLAAVTPGDAWAIGSTEREAQCNSLLNPPPPGESEWKEPQTAKASHVPGNLSQNKNRPVCESGEMLIRQFSNKGDKRLVCIPNCGSNAILCAEFESSGSNAGFRKYRCLEHK